MTLYPTRPWHLRSILLAILLVFTGCAILPPVQEMSDARQAIKSAQLVGAAKHAPDALRDAERYLQQATHKLEQGDYQHAQVAATIAREQAIHARNVSLLNKKNQ